MLDVLFLGNGARTEFREARSMIAETANLVPVPDAPSAVAELRSRQTTPLVVVATAYPGQVSTTQVAKLREVSPLARVVALLGSWCEGELRTGQPWPADARIFWHEWPVWWSRAMAEEMAAPWRNSSPPLTANSQDRLLTTVATWQRAGGGGLAAISAGDHETFAAVATALEVADYRSAWVPPRRPPVLRGVTAGIWIGGQLSPKEEGELALFCRRIEPAPVVAMLDFPRTDAVSTAQDLGATQILGKPFSVDDLLHIMAEFARSQPSGARAAATTGPTSRSA